MTTLWPPVDFGNNKLWDRERGFDYLSVSGGSIEVNIASRYPSKPLGSLGCEIHPLYGGYFAGGAKRVNNLTRFRQAFWLHMNDISMADGQRFTIARDWRYGTYDYVYRLVLWYYSATGFGIQPMIYSTSTSYDGGNVHSDKLDQDGWNLIELEWICGSSGTLQLWINGFNEQTLTRDNSALRVNWPSLCTFVPSAAVTGSIYVDYWRANDDGSAIGA